MTTVLTITIAVARATTTSSAITARKFGIETNSSGPRVSFVHKPPRGAPTLRGSRADRTSKAEAAKTPAARTKMPPVPSTTINPAAISGLSGPSSSDAIRDRARDRV